MSGILQNYKEFDTGELAGSTSITQFPDIACKTVLIKAKHDNAGRVYVGKSDVTVPNEVLDATAGYPLAAGEEVRIFCGNLEMIYYRCDNAGDAIHYLWQR